MSTRFMTVAGASLTLFLTACGGSSSSPSATPGSDMDPVETVLTGVFVDSAVQGVSFETASQSGITNSNGEFNYLAGEQVTFSIGSTQLPSVAAAAQVSPVDIAANGMNSSAMTTNIARLLQSLDQDGNPENGIVIPETASASAASIEFDVSLEDFANNTAVINLVANSGSVTTTLISADDANAHLNATLGITTDENPPENPAFETNNLVSGTPWYAVRVYEDGGVECGNIYSFASDGSMSAVSNGDTVTGTYSLSDSGLLNIDTVQFGVENWQLVSLTIEEWSTNKTNNSGRSYLERSFANRDSALNLSASLGENCEAVFGS